MVSEAGVSVLGTWDRGRFDHVRPETHIEEGTVLLLGGSAAQLARYNERFRQEPPPSAPVMIIGGGRGGRAAGPGLLERGGE